MSAGTDLYSLTLELAVDPAAGRRLARQLGGGGAAPVRRRVAISWYDTKDHQLAADGLALARERRLWRLERLTQDAAPDAVFWPPGAPAPVLAEAADLAAIDHLPAPPLAPCARFAGQEVAQPGEAGVMLRLRFGTLLAGRAVGADARLILEGPAAAVEHVAAALAEEFALAPPRVSLAAEALALATGRAPSARHGGPPRLPASCSVDAALARIIGHLAGPLGTLAPEIRRVAEKRGGGPEPVHQMRVATRRLRSVLALFRPEADCPELAAVASALQALSRLLAPARDWDVFLAGLAAEIAAALPDAPELRRLLRGAERQRRDAYAALAAELASTGFRRLLIGLAVLAGATPWRGAAAEAPLVPFARRALARRHAKLCVAGEAGIAKLPADALHRLRLSAKRLRYASEFFAPLWPGKAARRFVRRLAELQDRLGEVNDGAVAAALMAALPGRGHERARGLVIGFATAGAARARRRAARAWDVFREADIFWR